MTTFLRTFLTPRLALLATAALAFLAAAPLRAADLDPNFDIAFGVKADAEPGASFPLRTSVQQPLFVWVLNSSDKDREVTVELRAGDAPVEGTVVQHVVVPMKGRTEVLFPKPAVAPASPGTPPVKLQGPVLQEVKGDLQVVVLDKDGPKILAATPLQIERPSEYVEVTKNEYDPKTNSLTIGLKAKGEFSGPPCHVELVLSRDRIPHLIEAPQQAGAWSGYLGSKGTLTLKAEHLQFDADAKEVNGLVYLNVDGWKRAFTFYTTFLSKGDQPGALEQIKNVPTAETIAPRIANPSNPLLVSLEVDMNGPAAGKQIALSFNRTGDDKPTVENGDQVRFSSDREKRILAGVAPTGALLLQPEVQDLKQEWNVTGVFGPRVLELQVLKEDGNASIPLYDSTEAVGFNALKDWQTKDAVTKTVMLDAAPLGAITFTIEPHLKRGDDLPVKAWITEDLDPDKHADVKEVSFYIGRPGPDGAAPPTAQKVKGVWDEKIKKWAAILPAPPAPTNQKGKFDVTATFVKATDVPANGTITIVLEDPTPATGTGPAGPPVPAKPGRIVGSVLEGGRGQPGLAVQLTDGKGAVLMLAQTDAKGAYEIKDVPPGAYTVTAAKTIDNTKGATAVQVLEDKTATADVKLLR